MSLWGRGLHDDAGPCVSRALTHSITPSSPFSSSGGLATYLTCDRVGEQIRAANPVARFTCLADAGFFIKHDTVAGVPAATNSEFEQSFYAWNSSAAINEDCLAHYAALGAPEQCIFAQNVLPFIKSRVRDAAHLL